MPRFVKRVVGVAENVGAGIDQRPQESLVTDDRGVVRGMRRMGHRLHDVRQSRRPADSVEIALRAEPLHHDCGVDPLARVVQIQQVLVEQLMRLVGKILGPQNKRDVVADIGLQQDATEHSLLGVDVGRPFTGVE